MTPRALPAAFVALSMIGLSLWANQASAEAPAVDAAAGKQLYDRNCLACHGAAGAGDGPASRALRPPPTAFNTAAFWTDKKPAEVKAAIRSGRPGTSMMAFGSLDDAELNNVVAYLRSLAPTE